MLSGTLYKSDTTRHQGTDLLVQGTLLAGADIPTRQPSYVDMDQITEAYFGLSRPSFRQASTPHCPHVVVSSAVVTGPESLGCVLGKTLGSGTYAKVKAAWSQKQNRLIALKILNKKAASSDYLKKFLPRELFIVKRIAHQHIIQVHEILETENHCFFVLELAENGDLLDYINSRRFIPEPEARYIFRQITRAIVHCHSLGIAHRDLKCENIMLSKDMDVRVGDFGFATDIGLRTRHAMTPCGSYSYAAPELFGSDVGESYDAMKADVWSMGVILYAMVCGRLPFGDDSQVKKLVGRELKFCRPISTECQELIKCLLDLDPVDRIDSSDLLATPWLAMDELRKPFPIVPESQGSKYTMANCLPPECYLMTLRQEREKHIQRPAIHMTSEGQFKLAPRPCGLAPYTPHAVMTTQATLQEPVPVRVYTHSPKFVARIGACGRRIADAVKHVGHHHHSRGSRDNHRPHKTRSQSSVVQKRATA